MLDELVMVLQITIAVVIIAVWIFRPRLETDFRAGDATNIVEEFAIYGLPKWSVYVIGVTKLTLATVRATVEPESLGEINRVVKEDYLPSLAAIYPGLSILKGGSQEAEADFYSEIVALYTIALFVIYALIAVAFRSYSLPLLIMTAMPFGFMGAVFGHLLFNLPMAMFSYFGIGAAAGVVINDNLVLIDYVRRLEREGMPSPKALVTSAISRFRPIFLTTVTTFIGLIPIMAEQSTGAEFLKPAVLSLAFGVFFALFVSLLLVPAMYLIGYDYKQWRLAKKTPLSEENGAAAVSG